MYGKIKSAPQSCSFERRKKQNTSCSVYEEHTDLSSVNSHVDPRMQDIFNLFFGAGR
jgi:hypothetical protein